MTHICLTVLLSNFSFSSYAKSLIVSDKLKQDKVYGFLGKK